MFDCCFILLWNVLLGKPVAIAYLLKDFPGALGGLNKSRIIIICQFLGGFQHIGALLRQSLRLMTYEYVIGLYLEHDFSSCDDIQNWSDAYLIVLRRTNKDLKGTAGIQWNFSIHLKSNIHFISVDGKFACLGSHP